MKLRKYRYLLLAMVLFAIPIIGSRLLDWYHWRQWRETPDEATGVALELSPPRQVIKSGEIPQLVVKLVNRGSQDVVLVEPGDGSHDGWRTPFIEWSRTQWGESRFCGNINAITSDEVFTLKPGESHQLNEGVGIPYLSGPGRYRVAVRYTNQPDHWIRGIPLGEHDQATLRAIRQSTPLSVVSNAVEIEVKH